MARPLAAWWLLGLVTQVAAPAHARDLWQDAPRPTRNRAAPSLDEMVRRARPAVVQVRGRMGGHGSADLRRAPLSVGTGFFVQAEGTIITNEHVVRGVSELRVRLADGRELPACVLGVDAPTDIALLRARPPTPMPLLPFGDSRLVAVGEPAIVIGNPFGFDHSVTVGVISAKDRVVDRGPDDGASASMPYSFYLQTDAAINVGNSGGPLLDAHGAVVGVAAAFWGSGQPAQGIGFAIPIDIVKRLLPQLHAEGAVSRSWLGVDSQPLDPELAEAFGLDGVRGALLANVQVRGAAARAGLLPGDIILAWDGHPIAGLEDFKIYAQLMPPGTRVRVQYLRTGKEGALDLVTQAQGGRREPRHAASCPADTAYQPVELGLELRARTRGTGADPRSGVVVRAVKEGAGRAAGLLPGDVLLQVGAREVTSPADFLRLLNAGEVGRPMPVLVRRDGFDFWVALALR